MTLKNVAVNTNMLVIKKNILLVGSSCTEKIKLALSKPYNKTSNQWTECCRTGIHDLQPVKASQKANR